MKSRNCSGVVPFATVLRISSNCSLSNCCRGTNVLMLFSICYTPCPTVLLFYRDWPSTTSPFHPRGRLIPTTLGLPIHATDPQGTRRTPVSTHPRRQVRQGSSLATHPLLSARYDQDQ